jgi:membrane-associated phospholipid phosphatase
MKTAAQFISEFFSPLLVPLLAFMMLLSAHPWLPATQKIALFAIAAIFSSGCIFLYVYYLKHKRVIDSTELIVREQRISPLTFSILSYSLGYLLLNAMQAPPLISGFMFCYATNTLVLLLITRGWKISMHTSAIASAVVALHYAYFSRYGLLVIALYGLIPLVGLSRVVMQRQSIVQVLAGGILGLVMTALQLRFFLAIAPPVVG